MSWFLDFLQIELTLLEGGDTEQGNKMCQAVPRFFGLIPGASLSFSNIKATPVLFLCSVNFLFFLLMVCLATTFQFHWGPYSSMRPMSKMFFGFLSELDLVTSSHKSHSPLFFFFLKQNILINEGKKNKLWTKK